jgi:hypothetical protein
MPAKQRGKKQGKRTVNPDDGFASVAYESGRAEGFLHHTRKRMRCAKGRGGSQM